MTSSLRNTLLFAMLLAAIGLGTFYVKVWKFDYPTSPGLERTIWNFEIFLDFTGNDRPARLEIFVPTGAGDRGILEEQFFNGPFGLGMMGANQGLNRKAVWTYRYPSNRKVLRYKARIIGETLDSPLSSEMRLRIPRLQKREPDAVRRQAFIVWDDEMRRRSADDQTFAQQALRSIYDRDNAERIAPLLPDLPAPLSRLALAVEALHSQGINARIANGVYLDSELRRADVRQWLEYHVDGVDRRYFPGDEPRQFFPIWYGTDPLVKESGVSELDVQISMNPSMDSAQDVALRTSEESIGVLKVFNLRNLPLTTQIVFKVLLTIPVGITILVFLRQFIGIKTIGTFMPVLIGISFRETALLNGLVLFSALIAVGLILRLYLDRLKLLLVPRLAAVLVGIVITIAGITIMLTGSNQAIGLSISLFPMVILTMTIERMSIVWEESSPIEAIQQGVGSLAIASVTYLVMTYDRVEHLMFTFPELLFALMAACLLMGKYTGLRLSELWRFRALKG